MKRRLIKTAFVVQLIAFTGLTVALLYAAWVDGVHFWNFVALFLLNAAGGLQTMWFEHALRVATVERDLLEERHARECAAMMHI